MIFDFIIFLLLAINTVVIRKVVLERQIIMIAYLTNALLTLLSDVLITLIRHALHAQATLWNSLLNCLKVEKRLIEVFFWVRYFLHTIHLPEFDRCSSNRMILDTRCASSTDDNLAFWDYNRSCWFAVAHCLLIFIETLLRIKALHPIGFINSKSRISLLFERIDFVIACAIDVVHVVITVEIINDLSVIV